MAPLRQRTPYYSVASYVVGIPARIAASNLHVDSGYRIRCRQMQMHKASKTSR